MSLLNFSFPSLKSKGTAYPRYEPVGSTDVDRGTTINVKFICITAMKEYECKSLEELRLEDYKLGRGKNVSIWSNMPFNTFGDKTPWSPVKFDTNSSLQLASSKGTARYKYQPVLSTEDEMKWGMPHCMKIKFECITVMTVYESKSLEELRLEDYKEGRGRQVGAASESVESENVTSSPVRNVFNTSDTNSTPTSNSIHNMSCTSSSPTTSNTPIQFNFSFSPSKQENIFKDITIPDTIFKGKIPENSCNDITKSDGTILEGFFKDCIKPESIFKDTTKPESIFKDTTEPESIFKDTTEPESIFKDTTNPESIFKDPTEPESIFKDTTKPESIFKDPTEPESIFKDTTKPESIFKDTTKTESVSDVTGESTNNPFVFKFTPPTINVFDATTNNGQSSEPRRRRGRRLVRVSKNSSGSAPAVTASPFTTPAVTTSPFTTPAVTTSLFTTPAVTASPFSTPAVTASPFTTPAVTASPFSTPAVTASPFTTPAVTASPFTTPAVTASPFSTPAVTASPFSTPAVTASPFTTPAVTASPFSTPAVTASLFSTPAVTASPFSTPAVTASPFTTPAVTASPFTTPAVTASPFSTPAVTASPFSTPAVTASPFSTPAVTTSPFSTPAVTASPFSTPAVTTSPFSTPAVTASPFTTPAVTASPFTTPAVTTSPFTTPAVTASPFTTPAVTASPFTAPAVTASPFTTPAVTTSPFTAPAVTTSLFTAPKAAPSFSFGVSSKPIETTKPSPGQAELVRKLREKGVIKSDKVAEAMLAVDRQHFCRSNPYQDSPQPIGHSVNISAPHMHATVLELLKDHLIPGENVMDIGSGSGYLTVCMAYLTAPGYRQIVGIEVNKDLADKCRATVEENYRSLHWTILISVGDGRYGFDHYSPYNAIHVGAAAPELLPKLMEQLKPGGRLVMPIGPRGGPQQLTQVDKKMDGTTVVKQIMSVSFGPLLGGPLPKSIFTAPAVTTSIFTAPAVTTSIFTAPAVTTSIFTAPAVTTSIFTAPAVTTSIFTAPAVTTSIFTAPAVTTSIFTAPAVTTSPFTAPKAAPSFSFSFGFKPNASTSGENSNSDAPGDMLDWYIKKARVAMEKGNIAEALQWKQNAQEYKEKLDKRKQISKEDTVSEVNKSIENLKISNSSYRISNVTGSLEEAKDIINKAREKIANGDLKKAEELLLKAENVSSEREVRDSVRQVRAGLQGGVVSTVRVESVPTESDARSDRSEPTPDQIQTVRRVMEARDHYQVLGVSSSSSKQEVIKARRTLWARLHADNNKAPGADDAYHRVSEAATEILKLLQ